MSEASPLLQFFKRGEVARDVRLLIFVATHYVVTARQVAEAIFRENRDRSVVRRRLATLVRAGLLAVARAEVVTPFNFVPCPV